MLPPLKDSRFARPGWKMHITVPDHPDKPGFRRDTLPVIDFCRANSIAYKVGGGMTLYVGPRREMESFAQKLAAEKLAGLTQPDATPAQATPLPDGIAASYDLRGYDLPYEHVFAPQGAQGVPFLRNEILLYDPAASACFSAAKALLQGVRGKQPIGFDGPVSQDDLLRAAHGTLIGMHQDHYLGDGHGPEFAPAILEKLKRAVPVGYGVRPGPIPGKKALAANPLAGLKAMHAAGTLALFNAGRALLGHDAPRARPPRLTM